MWLGRRIAVVIPAFGEERLIGRTLASLPDFVDHAVVVDDASPDRTADAVRCCSDPRVELVRHSENRGVGAAIATGYGVALRHGADVMAVMAGDAQMDPADLPAVIDPVARGDADYVKGNRFLHPEAHRMPVLRRMGSGALAVLTRAATGLSVDDTQCGYTALGRSAAQDLPLDELWPRFGYPNDLLGLLASRGRVVKEVAVRPVYADEKSGLRPWHVAQIAGVILRRWSRERPEAFASSRLSL